MKRGARPRRERELAVPKDRLVEELRRLRARVPSLTGTVLVGPEGAVVARDVAVVDAEGVAALTAAAVAVALRLAGAAGQGGLRELLVHAEQGYVACYPAGSSTVLTALADPRGNVGRLHLEARAAGLRIGRLLDAAAGRPGDL